MQALEDLAKPAMLDVTRLTMQHEQTRHVALRRRHLRDQLWRQIEIKVCDSHLARASLEFSSVTRRQLLQRRHDGDKMFLFSLRARLKLLNECEVFGAAGYLDAQI